MNREEAIGLKNKKSNMINAHVTHEGQKWVLTSIEDELTPFNTYRLIVNIHQSKTINKTVSISSEEDFDLCFQ